MRGKEDYKKFFKREESENYVYDGHTFNKPPQFDNRLLAVMKRFGLMVPSRSFYNNYQ
jgi:hypothetical protein